MKKGNPLLEFIAGIALFALGLFWFTSLVTVTTGFGFRFGRFNITGGVVVVPFLIGVVWWFIDTKSIIAKVLTVLGVLIIIGSVIANTTFMIRNTSLFNYLLMLVLVCAGLGLIARVLFKGDKEEK